MLTFFCIIKSMKISLPSGYQYELAHDQDGPSVKAVVYSCLEEYGLPIDPGATDADLNQPATFYKNGFFGVVKNTGTQEIVGTFGLLAYDESSIEIRKMYLLHSHRGKGIGRFMMDYLLNKSKEMGYHRVVLETASVLKEAIAMYEQYGFQLDEQGPHTCRCDRLYYLDIS